MSARRVYVREIKGCNARCDKKNRGSPLPPSAEVYDADMVEALRKLGFFVVRREDVEEKEE